MAAIDTLKPGIRTGNFAPCRAGGFVGNHLIHSSFIPAKSASSRRMTVTLTTRSREVPAALRMADTFSKHCLVCSWIVSPTIFPVIGSCGPVPETNTRPAARTAWLYVGGADGAFGVRMMSLATSFSTHHRTTRTESSRLGFRLATKASWRRCGRSPPASTMGTQWSSRDCRASFRLPPDSAG